MLMVCRNALEGTISPRLGELGYLQVVDLSANKFTGQIPGELFKGLNLTQLDLSNNDLSGDVPVEIGNVGEHLQVLELRGNGLTGLPEDISYCYRLQQLDLSDNNITSLLPTGLGSNLTQLERLDLSTNRFSGTIPDDFGSLTALKVLFSPNSRRLGFEVHRDRVREPK